MTTTDTAPARFTLWTLDTDRRDRTFRDTRPLVDDWLRDAGVPVGDLVDGSTIRLVTVDDGDGLVQLSTWQTDRDAAGETRPCPNCQHCLRGRERLVPLTAPIPSPVAAVGWPSVDAPADWLTHVNAHAAAQRTPAPADQEAAADA